MSMTSEQIMRQIAQNEIDDEEREAFQGALEDWLDMPEPVGIKKRDISEALYSFEENNLFPDYVDSVSIEQAILCWKIVQRVRLSGFPKELRM